MSRATSRLGKLAAAGLAALLGFSPSLVSAQNPSPTPPPPASVRNAQIALRNLSVAQKVGQLFLIQFDGDDASVASDIGDLIVNYKVGGVQLKASRQNFANGSDGPRQVLTLTNRLQSLAALGGSAVTPEPATPLPPGQTRPAQPFNSIPLFIAISQEGDGWPNSEITQGLTPLPSEMALGATWKPELAEAAGRTSGSELARLGINLIFGPMLDIADAPKSGSPGDSGVRVFGGDPYWVGRFGAAMTKGLKAGSNGRLAVVATRFPGLGASDRNAEDEAPTVQRSMEQLRQAELAPFFAVTQPDSDAGAVVDGLLMSHIRFRGLQGNPRAVTNPISLDQQAQKEFMSQKELAAWRAAGGVTFSDALGARAVRRIYETPDAPFNVRLITQNAFRAGNDVLTLGAFGQTNSWAEQRENIKAAIRSFQERYLIDPPFAADVDAAAVRILALKLRLYGDRFPAAASSVDPEVAAAIKPNAELAASIAKESVTVLWPGLRDLPSALPAAPGPNDNIVFLTDDRQVRECARCAAYPAIPTGALRDIALRLYGPRTTNQLNPSRVQAFGFSDLSVPPARPAATPTSEPTAAGAPRVAPGTPTPAAPGALAAIDAANWIVVSMIDFDPRAASSAQIFRDFLAQRAEALRDKKIVVFAFGAPYHLDSTEVTKLTAYFALYQHTQPALEAAVRALYGEYGQGASPVSVSAISYAIAEQTQAEPKQIIPLVPLGATDASTRTVGTPAPLSPRLNDTLRIRAGPILDRNGRVIPDGTPVQFILAYPTEGVREPQERRVASRNGFAETSITFERKGKLQISVRTDTARQSDIIEANISDAAGEVVVSRPTPFPTVTSEPPPTVTPRPTETAVPPRPTATPPPVAPARSTLLAGFGLTLMILSGIALAAALLWRLRAPAAPETLIARNTLWSWTAGWAAYAAFGLLAPASALAGSGWAFATGIAVVTAVVTLVALWRAQLGRVRLAGSRAAAGR